MEMRVHRIGMGTKPRQNYMMLFTGRREVTRMKPVCREAERTKLRGKRCSNRMCCLLGGSRISDFY